MTKLECSANNCVHNSEGYCCKSSINVEGADAKCADDTCCASFSENTGGVFKNLFKTPESKLDVVCDADNCSHNEDHCCCAGKIDIRGEGACDCVETCCGTFTRKVTVQP